MLNDSDYGQNHLSANIIKVLWRQQQELLKKSPEYVTPIINNEDPLDIQIDLEGPKATPYEEGIFRVKLVIPNDFPHSAPKGFFMTKIFHPNISDKGEICVNTLKKDWNPRQWSLYNLFEVIKCLLIVPFPQSALNEEAGKLFMENYDEYFKIAKMYTKIYANKKKNFGNNNHICTDNNMNQNMQKDGNNIDDIEMKEPNEKNDDILNRTNYTQKDIHANNNLFESIGALDYRRMSEMPRSNYNLNYNCDNYTKINKNFQTDNKINNININNNFFNNNINTDSNCYNNINYYNMNNYKQFLSSKEKPNLSLLPLINANQIRNNNNAFGFHRSRTDNNISLNSNANNYNNSQEITKWLMRI